MQEVGPSGFTPPQFPPAEGILAKRQPFSPPSRSMGEKIALHSVLYLPPYLVLFVCACSVNKDVFFSHFKGFVPFLKGENRLNVIHLFL